MQTAMTFLLSKQNLFCSWDRFSFKGLDKLLKKGHFLKMGL